MARRARISATVRAYDCLIVGINARVDPLDSERAAVIIINSSNVVEDRFALMDCITVLRAGPIELMNASDPMRAEVRLAVLNALLLRRIMRP